MEGSDEKLREKNVFSPCMQLVVMETSQRYVCSFMYNSKCVRCLCARQEASVDCRLEGAEKSS